MYGHCYTRVYRDNSCWSAAVRLRGDGSPVFAQYYCLSGLTVQFTRTNGIHQDYKEFLTENPAADSVAVHHHGLWLSKLLIYILIFSITRIMIRNSMRFHLTKVSMYRRNPSVSDN